MISLVEHYQFQNISVSDDVSGFLLNQNIGLYRKYFKNDGENICYSISIQKDVDESYSYDIETSYFVGLDRIEGLNKSIYIEPKLNKNEAEIDVFNMLFEAMSDPENFDHLQGLVDIDFISKPILINQKKDLLTPFLVIQFIKVLSNLVKKGIKKSYYKTSKNLKSRIKGRILINKNINKNIVKNNRIDNYCEYPEFGTDIPHNQFLKYVLRFLRQYLEKFPSDLKRSLKDLFNYINPSFETVTDVSFRQFNVREKNPFYSEYNKLFEIGNLILKIQGFNINKFSETKRNIPPYWIDMSKLFELYVFKKLREEFTGKGEVIYHRKFKGGKETDIILKAYGYECVIDCKYKPRYDKYSPSLEDMRQLSGYCRLKSVYKLLDKDPTINIKGLIIYSSQNSFDSISRKTLFQYPIPEYIDFYKLPLSLPIIP